MHQVDRHIEDVDKAMRQLRRAMRGMQIRTAGFKKDHDTLAREIAKATTVIADAKPLFDEKRKKPGGRPSGPPKG